MNFLSQIHPTPVFWLSISPMPITFLLNLVVFYKLLEVRRLSRHHQLKYPKVYHTGKVLSLWALICVMTPALVEWRIFVQNPRWLYLYLLGNILAITGLMMSRRGLDVELGRLSRRRNV